MLLRRPLLILALLSTSAGVAGAEELLPSIRPAAPSRFPTVLGEVVVSAGLLGAAFALDDAAKPGSADKGFGRFVEEPGEALGGGAFLLGGTLALGAGSAATHDASGLTTAKRLALSLGTTTAVVGLLKRITDRTRPDGSNDYSFPSGHAAGAFAAATVIAREHGRAVGALAYGAAAAAGYARLANNKHYLSDVVAGAIIGRLIGRAFTPH
jgi:membrane-associated phospholipid phosphatase